MEGLGVIVLSDTDEVVNKIDVSNCGIEDANGTYNRSTELIHGRAHYWKEGSGRMIRLIL